MKIFMTGGSTKVPLDDFRFIKNVMVDDFLPVRLATSFLLGKDQLYYYRSVDAPSPYTITENLYNAVVSVNMPGHRSFCERHRAYYTESTFDTYNEYQKNLIGNISSYNPDIIVMAASVSDADCIPFDCKIPQRASVELYPIPSIVPALRKEFPKAFFVGTKFVLDKSDQQLKAILSGAVPYEYDMIVGADYRDLLHGNYKYYTVAPNENSGNVDFEPVAPVKDEISSSVMARIKFYQHYKKDEPYGMV